jgi:nitroreductase
MTATIGINVDAFRAAVSAAVRAPSVYNAQPWRFALHDGAIEVRIDPYRLLPVADPDRWAARIACGAAIANIQLSLAVAGVTPHTRVWPSSHDPLLVAAITGGGPCTPSPRQTALHAAIPHRHSNRRPFFDAPVPLAARAHLSAAAEAAGAWLAVIYDREPVARVADIIRRADERLRRDAAYVAEMNAWISRAATERTGIPVDAAGTAPAGQDLLAMRDYGGKDRAVGKEFEQDPLIAVLGTRGNGRHDDVIAGVALQHVLLTATCDRLATSMLSQPVERSDTREELRQAVGRHGRAQLVIRVGFGQPVADSPRQPIDSVIDGVVDRRVNPQP